MILVPHFANSYGFNFEKIANKFQSTLQSSLSNSISSSKSHLNPSEIPNEDALENIDVLTSGMKVNGSDFESEDLKIEFDFNIIR